MSQCGIVNPKLMPRPLTNCRRSRHIAKPHSIALGQTGRSDQEISGDSQKRVRKACERCRARKTKCGSEFPCKRCKNDGAICTGGARRKTAWKKLSPGYVEVLENSHLVLVATVHKLYAMIREDRKWDLGEPGLNDRNQPIVHNIAFKLGCLQLHKSTDLPARLMCPENEDKLAELAAHLEAQERAVTDAEESDWSGDQMSCQSSSESSQSDLELDAQQNAVHQDSIISQSPYSESLGFSESTTSDCVSNHSSSLEGPFPSWVMESPPAWRRYRDQLLPYHDLNNMYMLGQSGFDVGFAATDPQMLFEPELGVRVDVGEPAISG